MDFIKNNYKWLVPGILIIVLFFYLVPGGKINKITNSIFSRWQSQIIKDYEAKQKVSEEKIAQLEKEKEALKKEFNQLKKEREGVENEMANITVPKTYEETYKRFVNNGLTPLDCSCVCK